MDPNDPGQTPRDPAPPVWGPPPAPDQPGYGAPPAWGPPPAPDQPDYGAEPAWGQPPAPYGAPPASYGAPPAPYGAPPTAWGAAAPMSRPSMLPRLIAVAVVLVVLAAAAVFVYGMSASQAGKVVFSTDLPPTGTHTGCTINHQVTSVGASTSVYATYIFKSKPGSEVISLTVTRDGGTFIATVPIPTSDTQGIDCFSDTSDLSQLNGWGPGAYHFSATSGGSVVAEGDLTVK